PKNQKRPYSPRQSSYLPLPCSGNRFRSQPFSHPGADNFSLSTSAEAATTYTYTYYAKYTGSSSSFVDALKSLGIDSSYSSRKSIAALNGISSYTGTSSQNTTLLKLLKQGKLVKSKTASSSPSSSSSTTTYYAKYTGSSSSFVDALKSLGIDSSYSNRKSIAALNGISSYTGTSSQNTTLLKLLKQGKLVKSKGSSSSSSSTSLVSANMSSVNFIKQGSKTCKATSLAMSLNLLLGTNTYTTAKLGSSCCVSVNGNTYKASNGSTYKATYKTDSYVGSATEQLNAVERAIAAGVPIVVAVHSTKSGGTQHHWIIIYGKDSSGNYLIIDPASGTSGTKLSNYTKKTMSSANYAFGLTDYSTTHYGYITFTKV
ncbi:MAG: hypothetical protein LUG57_06715, partial [Oscillospiraceae bacterium]|nr:hypothetical protein [Oscillospiraceae bacterium]